MGAICESWWKKTFVVCNPGPKKMKLTIFHIPIRRVVGEITSEGVTSEFFFKHAAMNHVSLPDFEPHSLLP